MAWKNLIALSCLIASAGFAEEEEAPKEEVIPVYRPAIYDVNLSEHSVGRDLSLALSMTCAGNEIVVLSDDSVWSIHPLEERLASMWERLRGSDITQPEARFFAKPSEWKQYTELNVYRFPWSKTGLDQIYDFDKSKLAYCTHMIENATTGEIFFARPLKNVQFIKLMNQLLEQSKNDGFHAGYDKGFAMAKEVQ